MHETKEILEGPQRPCPDLLVVGQETESLPCLGKMRTVTGQDGSPTPADLPDIPAWLHRAQRRGRPCSLDARCVCLSPGAKRAEAGSHWVRSHAGTLAESLRSLGVGCKP